MLQVNLGTSGGKKRAFPVLLLAADGAGVFNDCIKEQGRGQSTDLSAPLLFTYKIRINPCGQTPPGYGKRGEPCSCGCGRDLERPGRPRLPLV